MPKSAYGTFQAGLFYGKIKARSVGETKEGAPKVLRVS